MIKIIVDNKEISVRPGIRVIDALRENGIEVPSMCYMTGIDHFTSCMVCLVRDGKTGNFYPSCSHMVEEGMVIISEDEEVRESRKIALELLLSEHVGDCEAPCQIACPAHMNIPLMNRLLAEGKFDEALRVVKQDIALPAVLGRICTAPCEGACRRRTIDEPVSICLLKRFAGDHDLAGDRKYLPFRESPKNKRVAVIGAGPAGLSAAYYLSVRGYDCEVYDRNRMPGGSLRKEVDAAVLPEEVLDAEIQVIRDLGVTFHQDIRVDAERFRELHGHFDAVLIAAGNHNDEYGKWGLNTVRTGLETSGDTFRIGDTGIFAVGSALRPTRLAIRALGQGKEVAFSIDQLLTGRQVTGEPFLFNSRFGKLAPEEFEEYLKESVPDARVAVSHNRGFSREEVIREAARCMHCDCRGIPDCKLRIYADQYGASQKRFGSDSRKLVGKQIQHDAVIFEPSKCIKCGICVRLTSAHKEEFGLTFIGRGFDVEVGVPFGESLKKGLRKVALKVADACPTGAISRKV
ncbi:MAG: (2Fe-2S)-binding protein [Bacteroidales bacterium]|nr:(2Fe-2S)-binding protein [Bacteroidales bacterium]